jgi:hypothetical protein
MQTKDLLALIDRPALYGAEIDLLYRKYERSGRIHALVQDGVSLAGMSMHAKSLAAVLARTVSRGEYVFDTSVERAAVISGKRRLLYRMRLTDAIVAGAVTRIVGRFVTPYLSSCCYSYQKGRSAWLAVGDLVRFLGEHRRLCRERRSRGLYVIKRDISAYGESIPVTDGSRLWDLLDDALCIRAGVPRDHHILEIVKAMIRPEIVRLDGERVIFDKGVPTGSPIQPLTNNLYLTPLDRALENIPGGFYARYGDDFLFAHPDPEAARRAAQVIDDVVAGLQLVIKDEKRNNTYFTGPGKPSTAWPECPHASRVEYLGCRIDFRGTVGLKKEKARRLLRDLRVRSRAVRRIIPPDAEARAQIMCAVANRVLDPRDELAHGLAGLLRHTVNDRKQLKQLDFLIALSIAETLSGVRGVKALRTVPYRKLRRQWGLASLVVARNEKGRKPKEAR